MNIFCRMTSDVIDIETPPNPLGKGESRTLSDVIDEKLIETDYFFHFPDVCFVDGVDAVGTVEESGD